MLQMAPIPGQVIIEQQPIQFCQQTKTGIRLPPRQTQVEKRIDDSGEVEGDAKGEASFRVSSKISKIEGIADQAKTQARLRLRLREQA